MAPPLPKKAPLVICGVNINAIYEPAQLHHLLQTCEDFNDKNKIFARLMDIMPGGPADKTSLRGMLERLYGPLRRQRRPLRRASEGAVSDSGTESGEDGGAGELAGLLPEPRAEAAGAAGASGAAGAAERRQPSPQLLSEAVAVLARLRESLGEGEAAADGSEVLQLVDRLESSLKQKVPPTPPPRRGASRRSSRRAQTVGITREELAEIRRRLAAARKQGGPDRLADLPAATATVAAVPTDTTGPSGVAARGGDTEQGKGGDAEAAAAAAATTATPKPTPPCTLYTVTAKPFTRRLSQQQPRRRVASPQRLSRGPPPPPWLGARRDPASSSVQRVVAAVNASNAQEPTPPPRRSGRQPRPHTIGANEEDFAAIRAAIDSELKREATSSEQERTDGESAGRLEQGAPERGADTYQDVAPNRQEEAGELVPMRAIIHESRGQYAQSSASRVQRQGDVSSQAGDTSPSQRSPRPAGSPDPRVSLASALSKQMSKEYMSDASRVPKVQAPVNALPGHQPAGVDPPPAPVPHHEMPAQTSDPVSESDGVPEPGEPAQYTCSIVTQETQTAELPPPSAAAVEPAESAPAGVASSAVTGATSQGRPDSLPVPQPPPVMSPSSPVASHPPWARQARVVESVSPEAGSPTPSSQPIWARRGRSPRERPASAEMPSEAAGGIQPVWARNARPSARSSSITRLASAFDAADAPPPLPSAAPMDRRTRLEKTRSMYVPDSGNTAPPAPMQALPNQSRKLSVPDALEQRHALSRSKSAEHISGRERHPLKQTPFHKFESLERQREAQMAALRAEQRAQEEHQRQLQQQKQLQQQQLLKQQQLKQQQLQQQQLHQQQLQQQQLYQQQLQQQQQLHQQQQQQQQPYHPPGIVVIPHQQRIPDKLQSQFSNDSQQKLSSELQHNANQHSAEATYPRHEHIQQVPHPPVSPHDTALTKRPPVDPHHHPPPHPASYHPANMSPPQNLNAEVTYHYRHHNIDPQPQSQNGHTVHDSPTHHHGPMQQSQGVPQQQDRQYQPSPPQVHGPHYSQGSTSGQGYSPQQGTVPQGPYQGAAHRNMQYHGPQYNPQILNPTEPSPHHQYPQQQQHHSQQFSGPHYSPPAHHYPPPHPPQQQVNIHNQGFQHSQGPPPQTYPQYNQYSQPHQQGFQQHQNVQHPHSPQYPLSPNQQQSVQHPYHQHSPQQAFQQPYVQHPPPVPHHPHQMSGANLQSPPALSPSGPLSPNRAAYRDGASPRSATSGSPQTGDRGFRPPMDSSRSRVFVPVSAAAAEAEVDSRPPWAGARGTGRVKQRAASLSGAEPPPPRPEPSAVAARPPSGDFGRHVSAFASTGRGRAPPRPMPRQASCDAAVDLRTAPLARTAPALQPDPRTAPLSRAPQQHQQPLRDHGPDLRTAPAVRATQQQQQSPRDAYPDPRAAPPQRFSHQPPQRDIAADLRTAPAARSVPQQQPPAPARPPPASLRTGGPLQRSSSSDVLRCGGGVRQFEARLDAASAQQKKQQLDSFFREREDERLARSFDDLLDDDDLALAAPAPRSAAGGKSSSSGAPHALSKSHTVGDMRSAAQRRPAPPASGSFARRQHAWESSTGASMAVGLGSSSYAPPPPPPPPAAEKASASSSSRSAGKSRGKKIDEDPAAEKKKKSDGFDLDCVPQGKGTKEVMLFWVQCRLRDYKTIKVENFSTSWADGMAFCALIHHFFPDAFDFNKLDPRNRRYNFDLAFRTGDQRAGIFPLLDADDMVSMEKPDWKSVFAYVQSIYAVLK